MVAWIEWLSIGLMTHLWSVMVFFTPPFSLLPSSHALCSYINAHTGTKIHNQCLLQQHTASGGGGTFPIAGRKSAPLPTSKFFALSELLQHSLKGLLQVAKTFHWKWQISQREICFLLNLSREASSSSNIYFSLKVLWKGASFFHSSRKQFLCNPRPQLWH